MRRRLLSSDSRYVIVVLTPIVLLIALFIYYPAVDTFSTSQTNFNLRIHRQQSQAKFRGFDNYVKLVEDDEFWEVTGRSFKVVLITLPLEMAVAFGIAMLLNQRFPGRGIVRTLSILPWMLPGVVNGFLWGWLLNGEYGALNGFLYQFGLIGEYQYWLREPDHQLFWVCIVQTWTRYAFPTIILLAGLQSIPDDLFDAAKVDGANAWHRLRYITFPLLLPSFGIAPGGRVHRRFPNLRCRLDIDRGRLRRRRHEPLHQDLDALQLRAGLPRSARRPGRGAVLHYPGHVAGCGRDLRHARLQSRGAGTMSLNRRGHGSFYPIPGPSPYQRGKGDSTSRIRLHPCDC